MVVEPTFGGAALAIAAVAAGAPLFADGHRAMRLRRLFARLRECGLDDSPSGLAHVRGRVVLESPLFAPLSGLPCAGFRLEARLPGGSDGGAVEERRAFRLMGAGTSARVAAHVGTWELRVTERRDWCEGQPLTENLERLLSRIPEWAWLRRRGRIVLEERALLPNTQVHVVAYARQAQPVEGIADAAMLDVEELLATGTGPVVSAGPPISALVERPDVWLGPGEALDFMLVTDEPPRRLERRVPAWRVANAALGPALGIAGLAYLAQAVDLLRSLR
jgi:hypothetical protein